MEDYLLSLDPDLVKEVDEFAQSHGFNRSEFTRQALRNELQRLKEREWERQMIQAYKKHPQSEDDFGTLFEEQTMPDQPANAST